MKILLLAVLLTSGCASRVETTDPTERGLRLVADAILIAGVFRAVFNK